MPTTSLRARLRREGYVLVRDVLARADIARLILALEPIRNATAPSRVLEIYRMRGLLESVAAVRHLAGAPEIQSLVRSALRRKGFAVRGLLFDKMRSANWVSPWHQDVAISVRRRIEVPGFRGWSDHTNVVHVQPPAAIQEAMVTLRIHLDDCSASKGPLKVIPRSHADGYLDEGEIRRLTRLIKPVACLAKAGDVLLLSPLLVHASSRSSTTGPRRVIHLQFAATELPGGLQWSARCGLTS